MDTRKIILGSAQFGNKYGITNLEKTKIREIGKIISYSKTKGIKIIDTAQDYGKSEKILGKINTKDFKIITKIKFDKKKQNIEKLILNSKKNLKKNKIYGVLFHSSKSLLGKYGIQLFDEIIKLKKRKLINKIGISIYSPNEFFELKKRGFKFDIIQIPLSIFDKRFLKNDVLRKIKKTGSEIHARSIFLQGLLLQEKKDIPSQFKKWEKSWNNWNYFILKNKFKKTNACINFVLQNKYINKIIIGISSLKDIKEIFRNYKKINIKKLNKDFTNDIRLIDPRLWK